MTMASLLRHLFCWTNVVVQLMLFTNSRFSECGKFSPTGRQTMTDEERLVDIIFRDYDPAYRPVYNASEPVDIIFGLNIISISKMDEIGQVLELTVWLEMYWKDKRLTWSPSDFSGLEMVRLPTKNLWSPDIVLYNSADEFRVSGDIRAMVAHTGEIFAGPYVKIRSTCILDLTLYPFDDQQCRLDFGSWSYDTSQLVLIPSGETPVLTQYVESAVWDLLDSRIEERRQIYSCCKHPFSVIIVSIRMRRRFLYNNLLNIFIPTCWLTFLTMLCFWLDPASGEKITLGITILVTFTLFQILVAGKTPRTSDFVPLIALYLETSYGTTAAVVGLQVFILNLHGLSPVLIAVPNWVRVVVLKGIARCLLLDLDRFSKHNKENSSNKSSLKRSSLRGSKKGSKYSNVSRGSSIIRPESPISNLYFDPYLRQNSPLIWSTTMEPVQTIYEDNDQVNILDQAETSSESSTLQMKFQKQDAEHIYAGLEEILDELQPNLRTRFLQRDSVTPYECLPASSTSPRLRHYTPLVPISDDDEPPIYSSVINSRWPAIVNNNTVKFYTNTPPSSPVFGNDNFNNNNYEGHFASRNTIITKQSQMRQSSSSGAKVNNNYYQTARSRFEQDLLRRLMRSVGYMIKREESAKTGELVVAEWRMIAFVLDRLAFWIFAVFTVSFVVLFLVALPLSEHAAHRHNMTLLFKSPL